MAFKHGFKRTLTLGLTLIITACSTVTIHPKATTKLTKKAYYEESMPFYFWGIKGEARVNLAQVCDNKPATQMQTQFTFEDGIMSFFTLGIYSPHTVRVWCEENTEVKK